MMNKKYWKSRKVLITGHEGFLGSWLTEVLNGCGAKIVGIDKVLNRSLSVLNGSRSKFKSIKGNVANFQLVSKVINDFKPQVIFHLAAEAIVGKANKKPINTFKSNIEGTWNILEAANSKNFIEAIIVASSDKAYGSHKKLPYNESFALQGDHPYDTSKSCADLICKTYFHTYNLPVCVTRCGNIYGPGDFNFSRLVPDAIRHVLKEKQFVIRSDGKFTRDYIYVRDIVDAYILLAENLKKKKLAGEAFNFSCEKPMSVIEFFDQIVKTSEKHRIVPKILNQAQYEIKHQYLSSEKAKRILRWKAKVNYSKGLKETLDWYQTHLNR